jgi:hypothetical protein
MLRRKSWTQVCGRKIQINWLTTLCASRGTTLVMVDKEILQNVQRRVLTGLP